MFGKKNEEKKPVKMITKEYECRQCHKVMCNIYVKPEDSDTFDDSYPCCWPCFLKLCEEASANTKKASAEKVTKVDKNGKPIAGRYPWGKEDEKK